MFRCPPNESHKGGPTVIAFLDPVRMVVWFQVVTGRAQVAAAASKSVAGYTTITGAGVMVCACFLEGGIARVRERERERQRERERER